jgi:hypothetical protein
MSRIKLIFSLKFIEGIEYSLYSIVSGLGNGVSVIENKKFSLLYISSLRLSRLRIGLGLAIKKVYSYFISPLSDNWHLGLVIKKYFLFSKSSVL